MLPLRARRNYLAWVLQRRKQEKLKVVCGFGFLYELYELYKLLTHS
jgi:hypothetical protein